MTAAKTAKSQKTTIKDEALKTVEKVTDKVRDALPDADIAGQVRDTMAKVPDQIDELTTAAGDQLQQLSADATTFVRRNPGYAIAGAVGVGVLIGLLAKRNS